MVVNPRQHSTDSQHRRHVMIADMVAEMVGTAIAEGSASLSSDNEALPRQHETVKFDSFYYISQVFDYYIVLCRHSNKFSSFCLRTYLLQSHIFK